MSTKSLLSKITEYFPKRKESCLKNVLLLVQVILIKETINLNKLKGCLNTVQGKTISYLDKRHFRAKSIFRYYNGYIVGFYDRDLRTYYLQRISR